MSPITLVNPTHQPKVDRILQGVIGVFEQIFPGRIFGNHFLEIYQRFLLDELRSGQLESQLPALRSLNRIVYPNNQAIISIVKELQQSDDENVRNAANAAAEKIH